MAKIIDRYLEIKKTDVTDKIDVLIKECFNFKIFETNPTNSHKKWFKDCYNKEYPIEIKELNKTLIKKLNKTISERKRDEQLKEKWKLQRAQRGYSDSDTWNMFSWFLEIMPKMLKQFRNNLNGYPDGVFNFPLMTRPVINDEKEEPEGMIKWKETLDRMIFLLEEMNENTCSVKNPYEKEYDKINSKFHNKYGFFGDDLKTPEQIEKEKKEHLYTMLTPSDFPDLYPDYEKLQNNYFKCEKEISFYRDRCREEFFYLFSKHFWDLWD